MLRKIRNERNYLISHFSSKESRKSFNIVQQISKVYNEQEIVDLIRQIRVHQASLLYLTIITRTTVIENECIELIKPKVNDDPKCLDMFIKRNKDKIDAMVKRIKHQKDTIKRLKDTVYGLSSADAAQPDTSYLSLITKHSIKSDASNLEAT